MSRPTVVRPAVQPSHPDPVAETDPFAGLLEAPEPVPGDDPFTGLLDALDREETLPATPPDMRELRDLFAAHAKRPDADPPRAPTGSHWPGHNFGPAYQSLRRERPQVRRPTVVSESDVWDIEALVEEAPAPTEPAESVPIIPWRTPSDPVRAPDLWLDGLDGDAAPRPTEARLIELVQRGPRPPVTLFDTTEVLQARPRVTSRGRSQTVAAKRLVPRTVEIAALAVLLLFALAILQLLLV